MLLMYTMYVTRHTNKFIKSARATQPRRLPVIDFQNEIAEMYVKREGVEEGAVSSDGPLTKGWAQIIQHRL